MKRLFRVACLATVVLTAPGAFAQSTAAGGRLDHLVCYRMKDPLKLAAYTNMIAELQPEFTQKGCVLVKPVRFCVPATKVVLTPAIAGATQATNPNIVGQPIKNDFVCYKAQCLNEVPPPDKMVFDQFGARLQADFQVTEVCVPAQKRPPGCGYYGNKCEGACPNAAEKCEIFKLNGAVTCDCVPRTTPCGGKADAAGICTGECPIPGDLCRLSYLSPNDPTKKGAVACLCQTPPTPLCGVDPTTGQCGGNCPNATDRCAMSATGKCVCAPTSDPCHASNVDPNGLPICGGVCPLAGQDCKPDATTGKCSCDPPAGCGQDPLTGQCGGDCPAPQVCLLSSDGTCGCQSKPCASVTNPDGTAQCGGNCTDPAERCQADASGACNCQPTAQDPCLNSCTPTCQPGQSCSLVPGTNICRCQ